MKKGTSLRCQLAVIYNEPGLFENFSDSFSGSTKDDYVTAGTDICKALKRNTCCDVLKKYKIRNTSGLTVYDSFKVDALLHLIMKYEDETPRRRHVFETVSRDVGRIGKYFK